jgi:hypothetical protein
MPRLVKGASALLPALLWAWSGLTADAQPQSQLPQYRLQEDRSAGVRAGTWHLVKDGKRVEFLDSRDVFSRHSETPKPVLFLDLFADPQGRVQQVRALPASETRKQMYINFLKKRYGYQISAVNQVYGIEASAFTELESSDFAGIDLSKTKGDDLEFAAELIHMEVEEMRRQLGLEILILAVVGPDSPRSLVKSAESSVDGYVIRSLAGSQPWPYAKPFILWNKQCPTVRPPFLAGCVRIWDP